MKKFLVMLLVVSSVSGCANLNGNAYSPNLISSNQAEVASRVDFGVVVSVKPVQIENNGSMLGTVVGAGAGGLAGSMIGKGAIRGLGIIGGALGGGILGNAITKGSASSNGLQITVRLEHGTPIVVTQGAQEQFKVGQQVQVITSQGKTRVSSIQ